MYYIYLTLGLSTPIPKLMVAAITGNLPSIQSICTVSLMSAFNPAWYCLVGMPLFVRREATSAQASLVRQYTIPQPNSD